MMTTMMNKRRRRYCNLRSMAELHKERAKLARMMKANKADLEEDWEDVSYWLSPSNLMNELMGRVCSRSSVIRNLIAGTRVVFSMIRGRKQSCQG